MPDRTTDFIVEVSCLVDFDELDADDLNEDGECAIDGAYLVGLTDVPAGIDATETVLDIFHDKIGIACLEDFEIVVRHAGPMDDESTLRHGLGTFAWRAPADEEIPQP
jgi:hypothetical protein